MLGWFKRKVELASIKASEQDIDRFIASLRGANLDELSVIVALATHWRNTFEKDGIDLLDPVTAEQRSPLIGLQLNRMIKDLQKDNPLFAVGLMVWLHTIRAASIPEVRYKGRMMWAELSKGFNGAYEAGRDLAQLAGIQLNLSSPELIPEGLEPERR